MTKYKYRVSKIGKSSGVGTKSLTQEAMRNNIRQQMGHTNPEDDENSFRHVLNDINDISLVNKRRNRRNDPDTLVDGDLPELTNYVDAGNKVVDKSDGQFAHQLSNILRKRNVSISDIKIPAMAHNHTIADSMKSASMSKLSKSALFRINETKRG